MYFQYQMMSPGKFSLVQGWKTLIASGYISSMMILQNQLVDDPALIVIVECISNIK